jgi:hypothetical protein
LGAELATALTNSKTTNSPKNHLQKILEVKRPQSAKLNSGIRLVADVRPAEAQLQVELGIFGLSCDWCHQEYVLEEGELLAKPPDLTEIKPKMNDFYALHARR